MKNKFMIFLLMFSIIIIVGVKVSATSDNFEKGKELFLEARELYQSQEDRLEAKKKFEEAKNSLLNLEEDFEKCYWLARTEYFLVSYKEEDKRKESYEKAAELGKKAIKYNKEHSDAYRILADIYLDSLEYRGILGQINYSGKGRKLLKESLKLDRSNYAACKSLGGYYIFAPKLFGGDVDKGVKLIKESLKSDEDSIKYVAYCLLGNLYEDQEDLNQAIKFVTEATEIYPKREDTQKWLKRLKNSVNTQE